MEMIPWLAYIVVQRRSDGDAQKLVKAAGIAGNSALQQIDVAMFLTREGAEEFRDGDIVFREYAEVVEVVVTDSARYTELENDFADAAARVMALKSGLRPEIGEVT